MTYKKILSNPFVLTALSAILLRLSYPKFDLWILAWVAFVPFFFAIEERRPLQAFLLGWLWGALFFVMTIFWLVNVTVAGMFVLSVYLGLYVAFFSAGCRILKTRLAFWQRLCFGSALWVVLEFVRSHLLTGFPWALLAYSQAYNLVAIQAADIFGTFGVSFIVMLANIFIFEILRSRRSRNPLGAVRFFVPCLIFALWLGYGVYQLWRPQEQAISCPLKVSMVQGNIPQEIKWAQSFQQNIFKKYQLLTEIARLKDGPDLIIWPETSYPDYLELKSNDEPLRDFARQIQVPVLAGSIRLQHLNYFNSALLLSPAGEIEDVYDKLHLVPFGEYIPARRFFSFLAKIVPIEDFTPGSTYKIFSVAAGGCSEIKFGVLICFEDIFGPLAAEFVRRGADFLVNMTNDAWFGDTSSPFQHMQASVLRAVENRVFVVRVANTGISCMIDDYGRRSGFVRDSKGKQTFVTGYATGVVHKTFHPRLYTKTGDIVVMACFLFLIVLCWGCFKPRILLSKGALVLVLGLCVMLQGGVASLEAAKATDQQKELALRYYRGVVNFEAGRYQYALTEFQAVAATDPYYRDTPKYIENCMKILEQARRGLYRPPEGSSLGQEDFDLYFLGKSYYEKGNYRKALDIFKAVLAKNPNDKFASYYAKLCSRALGESPDASSLGVPPEDKMAVGIDELEKEVAYIKEDIRSQEDAERFLETKVQRKAAREELIQNKEKQLKEQEELLEEERQDYMAQARIAKQSEKLKRETEKWKNMRMRLTSKEPGVPTDLTEYPVCLSTAESYYVAMKESLRTSRWNSAGLNGIRASISFCDAVLIYFYNIKSAVPSHENIGTLLSSYVKRSDTEENISHLRSILNVKRLVEDQDRPLARSEAIFLCEHAEKVVEWCRSLLP